MARAALENATVEQWDMIMAVNLRAPFLLLQEAMRSMKTRGGGSIVNIGSINAYVGLPQLGPYSVSKGGADDDDEKCGTGARPLPHSREPAECRLDVDRR